MYCTLARLGSTGLSAALARKTTAARDGGDADRVAIGFRCFNGSMEIFTEVRSRQVALRGGKR